MLFIKLLLWYCWIDSAFFSLLSTSSYFFFSSLHIFPSFLFLLLLSKACSLYSYLSLISWRHTPCSPNWSMPFHLLCCVCLLLRPQQLHCCCLFYVSLRSRVRFALISLSVFRLRLNNIFENLFVAVLRDRKRSSKFLYLLHVLCGSFSFFNVQDFSSFVLKYVFFSSLNSQFSFLKVLNEKNIYKETRLNEKCSCYCFCCWICSFFLSLCCVLFK